jgi:hypothetical protein
MGNARGLQSVRIDADHTSLVACVLSLFRRSANHAKKISRVCEECGAGTSGLYLMADWNPTPTKWAARMGYSKSKKDGKIKCKVCKAKDKDKDKDKDK